MYITETENILAKNECGPMIFMYIAVVAIRCWFKITKQ